MDLNKITEEIIGAAIEVHREIGPGLLESVYVQCLCRELGLRGLPFRTEVPLSVRYKGLLLKSAYRMDLLVAEVVPVEVKSIDALTPIQTAQLLTYLKLGGWQLGLLINFNVRALRHGIRRLVLGLPDSSAVSAASAVSSHP